MYIKDPNPIYKRIRKVVTIGTASSFSSFCIINVNFLDALLDSDGMNLHSLGSTTWIDYLRC